MPMLIPDAAALTKGLDAIRERDPGFDENAFLSQVQPVWAAVQRSEAELDPTPARPVMADWLWRQHGERLSARRAGGGLGRRHKVIGALSLCAASTDAAFDTVTVRIEGVVEGGLLGTLANDVLSGGAADRDWCEDWVFQRRAGALSRPGQGFLASRCPNCGAPADIAPDGRCSYCHVAVMSGTFDWVLSRVDTVRRPTALQIEELALAASLQRGTASAEAAWAPPPAAGAGVDLTGITAHDPGFNAYEFLALARAAVYSVDQARTRRDPSLSAGILSESLWALQRAIIEGEVKEHCHRVLAFFEITGAEIAAAGSRDGEDSVTVTVRCRGQDYEEDEAGAVTSGSRAERVWAERWTFGRGGSGWVVTGVDPALA